MENQAKLDFEFHAFLQEVALYIISFHHPLENETDTQSCHWLAFEDREEWGA